MNRTYSVEAAKKVKILGAVFGLLQWNIDAYLQGQHREVKIHVATGALIADSAKFECIAAIDFIPWGMSKSFQALITERTVAKQHKNFAESDRIRKELLEGGIVLKDYVSGTTWRCL
ncbi:MAG: hypothetical protein M3P47_03790 [Pseudomonadota bacterium]|nr:hypothetical protein [Pseudomonadota bacterium]